MITKKQYVEYLLSTPINYTCTNLADHLEEVSHDSISDMLSKSRFTPRQLWDLVEKQVGENDSEDAILIVDDSVQNKRYSHSIELVKHQYSGNEHRVIKGIGLVNLIHSTGIEGEFCPIDYRVYSPEDDGKTKNEHFREMFIRANTDKQIKARKIAFDSWYAGFENLKLIHRSGWIFFTTLKSNRKVCLSKETGYQNLEELEWDAETLRHGQKVRLQKVPFEVRLFKLVAMNGDIEWAITNDFSSACTRLRVIENLQVRWQVEEFHREFKQLTGSEKCQARKARSQRNHLASCYSAWLAIKMKAKELGKTVYQVKNRLCEEYLKAELKNPTIQALDSF